MATKRPPLSFELMHLSPERLRVLKPVTVLDIYTNNTESFHPDGLFSTVIFGRVGSKERDERFSFIDIKVTIFHPLYYKELIKLKRLYGEVITGQTFAIFDEKEKDLVAADELTGKTGFSFFLSIWDKIVFKETDSHIRKSRIKFLTKYRSIALTRYILVLPAGLRDMEMGKDGRTTEGEVNAYYRRLIGVSNTAITKGITDQRLLDTARCTSQAAFNAIYNMYSNLISGKHGFVMGKWASRNLEYGTRSVLTGYTIGNEELGSNNNVGLNNTLVGIYQVMKGIQPVVIHALKTGYLSEVFVDGSSLAHLVDPKTLKRVNVQLDSLTIDKWTTNAGLAKLIDGFEDRSVRAKPIKIKDNYLALIYKGKGSFKIFGDIDELPEGFDKKDVKPITYIEFFYLCNFEKWNDNIGFVTRYPIAGVGSIYPSYVYMKPTENIEKRKELGNDWQPTGRVANAYPVLTPPLYIDSMGVSPSRLGGLGADHDGDTTSFNLVYTKDAVEENRKYLNSAKAYISTMHGLNNSPSTDPVLRVIKNMTGEPQ